MKQLTLLFATALLISCNLSQSKLDKAKTLIEYAEQNEKEMTSEKWSNLNIIIFDLENELKSKRYKYSDDWVKEIGKIQGRYAALMVKKGIDDFHKSVKDLGNQMEGFIEGITDSTNIKNK